MAKRINIILADATLKTIDRLSRRGQRSRFIEHAVQQYVRTSSPQALQERLKQAALRDRDLDLEIAGDWSAVDSEQWQRLDSAAERRSRTGRKEGKSTSRRSTRR